MITPDLLAALRRAARAEALLVAADYDGTLAPIVNDPSAAFPHLPALDAIVDLSKLDSVRSLIISGRSRAELARLTGDPAGVVLVGTHGAEMPDHTHRGMEMTLVLQGAFRDDGERFSRGDVEVANDNDVLILLEQLLQALV